MTIRRFLADQGGAAGVYAAVSLAVVLGAGAMAADVGRIYTLHTQVQQAADAAALSGAAELDGQANARQRATAALVSNRQSFAGGSPDIAVASVAFLSSLNPDLSASGDDDAHFIQVVMTNQSLTTSLMGFVGGPAAMAANAQAVAGYSLTACSVTPLVLCNPEEPAAAAGETPFTANPGQQLKMNAHDGAEDQWLPGDYGWLVPAGDTHDDQTVAQWIAQGALPACLGNNQLGIRVAPDFTMASALNTRFDLYQSPYFSGAQNNPAWPPAVNVTKGMDVGASTAPPPAGPPEPPEPPGRPGPGGPPTNLVPGPCNPGFDTPPNAQRLPRDACFAAGTCSRLGDGAWMGTGNAAFNTYWSVNHGGTPPSGLTTRYQVYRWEIDNGRIPVPGAPATTRENGHPSCSSTPPSDNPDRRLLTLAVVNCRYHHVSGSTDGVNATAYLSAFLTEPAVNGHNQPVQGDDDDDAYVEVVSIAQVGKNPLLHPLIQLYR